MDLAHFTNYLAGLEKTEYLRIHFERYIHTWRAFEAALLASHQILELGRLSPVADFCRHLGKSVSGYTSDLRFAFDLPSRQFDLVLSLEVVEHINEPLRPTSHIDEIGMFQRAGARNMFSECRRVLKDGGALCLTTPNASSIDVLGNVLMRRAPHQYEYHVREYTRGEITDLATRAGFSLKAYQTFFAWNSRPDIDRDRLSRQLASLGFDISDRGDDAAYLFTAAR
jgi:SAM-dependent methyltransferase